MKIKLVKAWNGQGVGAVLEPQLNGVALTLIERGIAEEIQEAKKVGRPKKEKVSE